MKRTSMQGVLEFALEIKRKTEKAFLVTDGTADYWLPRSMVDWEEPDHVGATTSFYIPEWMAEEKGLI